MFRPSNLTWFVRSRKQALASREQAANNNRNPVCVAVLVILAAVTVLVGKAQADSIPIIEISILGIVPVVEGPTNGVLLSVNVTNPTPAKPVDVTHMIIALNRVTGDPDGTDRLTLGLDKPFGDPGKARLTITTCNGINTPALGVAGFPGGVTLGNTGPFSTNSCFDNIFIPTFDRGLTDESRDGGVPDSGISTVNVSVVTAGGVHSQIATVDVEVLDPPKLPEPSSALLLGSGLLALPIMLRWKRLRASPETSE